MGRARYLVAVALAALALPAVAGDDAAVREAVAARVEQGPDGLANALVELGAPAIEPLLDALEGGAVATQDGGSHPLAAEEREAMLDALGRMPASDVRAVLSRLADDPERDEVRVALAFELLERAGDSGDVGLCVRLASPVEEGGVIPRARRVAFEGAIRAIVARDADAARELRGAFRSLPASLLAPAARCFASGDPEQGLSILAELLGSAPGIDSFLLVEIAGVAQRAARPVDAEVRSEVRASLTARDVNEVVLAERALGALDDFDAFPALIDLLGSGDVRVSEAADDALEHISGRVLRGNARAWSAWYDQEKEWWRGAASTLARVRAADPGAAMAALSEISGHRIYRHQLAAAVVPAVNRRERQLVLVACSILRSLESRAVLPELEQALARTEPELHAEIERTYRALGGTSTGPPAGGPELFSRGR